MSATISAFPRVSRTTSFNRVSVSPVGVPPVGVPPVGARGDADAGRPASGRAVYFRPDATLSADFAPAPATATASSSATTSHLHITARGRTVVALVVIVPMLVAMMAFILSGGGAVASSGVSDVRFEHVTVSSGETLWQVAQQVAPASDPRDVVADIASLNNLQGTDVLAGQSLAIPTKYAR